MRIRDWSSDVCSSDLITHALDGFSGNEHVLPYAPLYDDVVQLYARSGIVYTPVVLMTYGAPFMMGFAPYYQQSALYGNDKVKRFYPPQMLQRRKYASYWSPPEERDRKSTRLNSSH